MNGYVQDLRYGARALSKNPGFAAVAILTLAFGIGANTAIFHVLDSVLLRALPVPRPSELVLLTDPDVHGHAFGSQGGDRSLLAYWEFRFLQSHNDVFASTCAADSQLVKAPVVISRGAAPQEESANLRLVSGDYFSTLEVKPVLGQTFGPEADQARGASPFAVISYSYWEYRFARDPKVLGTKISIHRIPFEIVAVAPPGFFGETVGEAPDIWLPLMMQDAVCPGTDLLYTKPGVLDQRLWLQVIARRKPGVTISQAGANIAVVGRRMTELAIGSLAAADRHLYGGQRFIVRPGAQGASVLRKTFGEPLRVLMALVGLVLLIACANVANLLLARGAAREKEFAVRFAIGLGRGRAIRQLLAESLLLAIPGAIAGFLLAQWADSVLVTMVPNERGRPGDIQLLVHPDFRMLLFTASVAIIATLLFGLAPGLRLARTDLSGVLKSGPGSQSGGAARRRFSLGRLLVMAQVAASLVMLVATGLFVHSLLRLSEVNLGFNPDHLIAFDVDPVAGGWKGASVLHFHEQLLQRLSTVAGIRSVTFSANGLFENSESGDPITVEGYTPQTGESLHSRMDHVAANYFSTVGIPILMGREIGPQDSAGARVAVINQAFARRFFPHTNPLGKHVRDTYYPSNPQDVTIVGVAADARYNSLSETTPARLYAPYLHPLWEQDSAYYEVRTFGDPASVASALRRAVTDFAPALPAVDVHPVAELVGDSLGKDRLVTRLSTAFAMLATLLASIGLYGLMSWTIARRTREIGVRMALGANRGRILKFVLRDTLTIACVGVVVGIPLSLAGARVIQGMLFDAGAADPIVLLLASVLLIAIATFAGFLPARRAARVDPIEALRLE